MTVTPRPLVIFPPKRSTPRSVHTRECLSRGGGLMCVCKGVHESFRWLYSQVVFSYVYSGDLAVLQVDLPPNMTKCDVSILATAGYLIRGRLLPKATWRHNFFRRFFVVELGIPSFIPQSFGIPSFSVAHLFYRLWSPNTNLNNVFLGRGQIFQPIRS